MKVSPLGKYSNLGTTDLISNLDNRDFHLILLFNISSVERGMIMEIAMVMKLVMITAIVGADPVGVDQILTRQVSSHPTYFAS